MIDLREENYKSSWNHRSLSSERQPPFLNSFDNAVDDAELGPETVQRAIAILEAAAESPGLKRLVGEIKQAYRFDCVLLDVDDNPKNNEFCRAALTEADSDG